MAARPAARRIGSLALTWEIAVRRGISSVLLLMLVATMGAVWAAGTAAPLRAQTAVRIELGGTAENLVPPESLLGAWHGVINRDGKPQPVFLSIKEVTPGRTAGKMTFASPRHCFIDLEYGGPDQGRHIFYMIRFTNCFDYGRDDFIALSQVPGEDLTTLFADDTEVKPNKASEILKKFDLGQPEPEPAPGTGPTGEGPVAAAPPTGLGRIVYAINLGGEVTDSAILKRK
jgi:hypothetical protein